MKNTTDSREVDKNLKTKSLGLKSSVSSSSTEANSGLKIISLAIVRNDAGEVLVIKRKKQDDELGGVKLTWVFPGGVVEEYESVVDAAVRETQEETGYMVMAHDLVSKRIFPNSTVYINYVSCGLLSGSPSEVTDTHEVAEVKWVLPSDLKNHFTSDLDKGVAMFLGL